MPVTTYHQYIDNHPAKNDDKRMILGTIHPHACQNFKIPFFYGNEASLWNILEDAFPQYNFSNKESILKILNEHNLWVSDIIKKCDRANEKVVTDDQLFNIVSNEEQISDALIYTKIDTIYLTSRFGKNNAGKIFTDVFNLDYRSTFSDITSEFYIPARKFGREIRCVALYSPSGSANIGISCSKTYLANFPYYQQFKHPVKQFKTDFYKEKFKFLNKLI